MPAQNFSLNEATAALASVQWSAGYSTVDLTYNGVLLTRITDAQSLRTTGLQGTAADGATLVLRLLPGVTGEDFSLERNGARMHAGPIDQFALSPSAIFPSSAPAIGVATAAQEKSMRSGRRWIRAVGILLIIGGVALAAVSTGEKTVIDGKEAVKLGDRYLESGSLLGVGIGLAFFGLLLVLIARFAKGARAKLMFGVGATLCLLLAVANLFGGSPLSALIPAAAGGSAIRAWRVARATASRSLS